MLDLLRWRAATDGRAGATVPEADRTPPGSAMQARQLDKLELATLAYLLLPLVIFIATWLRWPAALILGGLLVVSCREVVQLARPIAGKPLSWRLWVLLTVVAALWVALSGLEGLLPLNRDWSVRMVVLRDLTTGSWPVGYGPTEGGDAVLRFSLGYYLVPALVGKLAGLDGARAALALWTVGGVLLFFALAIDDSSDRRPRALALGLGVLVLFSGMDSVGWWMGCGCLPAYGQHIEWWSPWVQYSSQTTLLFWVPNHALPAWLLAGVAWRHRHSGLAVAPAGGLMLGAALWSPLVCLGLVPLVLACSARGQSMRGWLQELVRPAVLAVLPTTLLLAKFVTFGMREPVSSNATEAAIHQIGLTPMPAWMLLNFAFLEWGAVALVLMAVAGGARRLPWCFWVAVLELLCLPLLSFGPGNDLVMRGGIAPMTVLVLTTSALLVSAGARSRWRLVLLALLLLGSVTPLTELQRATLPGSRWPDDGRNLLEHAGWQWHYVGVLGPGWMRDVLRPPVPLASGR